MDSPRFIDGSQSSTSPPPLPPSADIGKSTTTSPNNMFPSVYERRLLRADGDIESAFDPWTGRRIDTFATDDTFALGRRDDAADRNKRVCSLIQIKYVL